MKPRPSPYAAIRNAYRVVKAEDAPLTVPDGWLWLYLCVFPEALKIGVSRSPHTRIAAHRKTAGAELECMYLLALEAKEARALECDIARFYGREKPEWTGHGNEWIDRHHLPLVTLAMRRPETIDWARELRGAPQTFDWYDADPHFRFVDPGPKVTVAA